MYGLTAKQIKTRGIISVVLAVVLLIGVIITGRESIQLSNMNNVVQVLASPLLIAWQFFAILLNWKKMLKGFIAPIPVISYCIETIKAMFVMVPKALFWALRNPEE